MMNEPELTVGARCASSDLSISRYMASIYAWMTGALILSGVVAWQASHSVRWIFFLSQKPGLFYGLIIAQLVAVIALAGWVRRMNTVLAALIFLVYSALTGLTLSTVFMVYTDASILQAFLASAGMFASLSVYGYVTKRDLSGWGEFLFLSLIGLVIASVINLFMNSPMLTWITTYAGIVIFAGLTAYDTQKLKAYASLAGEGDSLHKLAIRGALTLYLDFINLFLHLLRVMGNRR